MFRELMLGETVKMLNGQAQLAGQELVRGVAIDSRKTRPGELFFALRGSRTDGHRYVSDALRRGALAAVVEQRQSMTGEILVLDSLFALGELARQYRNLFEVQTVGITGTNGKTTVKNLIASILKRKYRVLHTEKNYNSLIGLPLTVFGLSGDEDYLVVEMGTSAPGEIARLCDIAKPDNGVITNIGSGHLDGLGSIEGIRKEKFSLIDALPVGGIALVGEGAGGSGRKNAIEFSADMLESVELTEHGTTFSYGGNSFFTQLLGLGNVYNCLAAICLTSRLGVDYETQYAGIAEMHPEPGRLDAMTLGALLIIDDTYNANPVSMKAAVDFVAQLDRKKVFVLGDMLELGEGSKVLHRDTGEYARKHADLLVTFGQESKYYKGVHFSDAIELLNFLVENITGDEVILFKASRALHFEWFIDQLPRLLR
jgi:UDP-N-acetylmuramoyl-tripeptide--D-alanyl-D-alanine ligase